MLALKPPLSPLGRDLDLERLASVDWDLLVVGGGITGVALARDAALRGLRVALVEEHDIAFGTSSRSSRLIHGGLRYLASAELGLVREGLRERHYLLRTAPHLVRAERFAYLVYSEDPDALWKIRLGVALYALLATGYRLGPNEKLSPDELGDLVPGIRTERLDGAVCYFDGATHDARLTLAVAAAAREAGATLLTRCRVDDLTTQGEHTSGVVLEDTIAAQTLQARARVVVLCTGPWQALHRDIPPEIRTARGSHVSLRRERLPIDLSLVLRSPEDGRQTFALPVGDHTVLGTTDVDDATLPDRVRPTIEDTDYLLAVANHAFRGADLGRGDVVGAWAGLRPLVAGEGEGDPDALSRRHRVIHASPGLWILAGGKLTTHRHMAEDCLDRILSREDLDDLSPGRCRTRREPLATGDVDKAREELWRLKAGPEVVDRLLRLYDARLGRLTAHLLDAPPLALDERVLIAQTRLAATEEGALALDDVLLRRIEPGPLDLERSVEIAPLVAREMADLLGWTREQTEAQVEAFRRGAAADLEAARGPLGEAREKLGSAPG